MEVNSEFVDDVADIVVAAVVAERQTNAEACPGSCVSTYVASYYPENKQGKCAVTNLHLPQYWTIVL